MTTLRNFLLAQRRSKNINIQTKCRSLSIPGANLTADENKAEANRPKSPMLEDLECPICKEEYCDERKYHPRTLPCGHTFCTLCIDSLLSCSNISISGKSKKECPVCRTSIKATNISNIPISFTVLSIVIELNQQRLSKRTSLQQCSIQSVGFCKNHNSPKQFWCKSCSVWLCGACALLKHKENKTKCEIQTVDDIIASKKCEHETKYEIVQQSHAAISKSIDVAIDVCRISKTFIQADIENLEQKLKESKLRLKRFCSVRDKMKELSLIVNNEWESFSLASKNVQESKDYSELSTSSIECQSLQTRYLEKKMFVQFPFHSWTRKLLVECLLEYPHTPFYAEYDDGAKHWFRISLRSHDLCIHSGSLERPPIGSLVAYLDDIVQNANTFFFDIYYDCEIEFRLKIQITSPKCDFSLTDFCLARGGKSYKESKFFFLEKDSETETRILWVNCLNKDTTPLHTSIKTYETKQNGEVSDMDFNHSHQVIPKTSNTLDAAHDTINSASIFKEVCPKHEYPSGTILSNIKTDNSISSNFGILLDNSFLTKDYYIEVGSTINSDIALLSKNIQEIGVDKLIVKDCGLQINNNT